MENGVNPRAIQKAMGHSSLETTMGYLHAESLSVNSPLETDPRRQASAPYPESFNGQ
jgi:site-specific recombinase XerD